MYHMFAEYLFILKSVFINQTYNSLWMLLFYSLLWLKGTQNWIQNWEGCKQHWDSEISAYLINILELIFMLIAGSGESTFWIYFWKSVRDIKV